MCRHIHQNNENYGIKTVKELKGQYSICINSFVFVYSLCKKKLFGQYRYLF
jgi:hypothetical protein